MSVSVDGVAVGGDDDVGGGRDALHFVIHVKQVQRKQNVVS